MSRKAPGFTRAIMSTSSSGSAHCLFYMSLWQLDSSLCCLWDVSTPSDAAGRSRRPEKRYTRKTLLVLDLQTPDTRVYLLYFQTVTGSTTLFTALLKKCIDRDVVPICKYIPGKSSPPRFVALMPQVHCVL